MFDDVVGQSVEGFSKKGAMRLGLFLWPPGGKSMLALGRPRDQTDLDHHHTSTG